MLFIIVFFEILKRELIWCLNLMYSVLYMWGEVFFNWGTCIENIHCSLLFKEKGTNVTDYNFLRSSARDVIPRSFPLESWRCQVLHPRPLPMFKGNALRARLCGREKITCRVYFVRLVL